MTPPRGGSGGRRCVSLQVPASEWLDAETPDGWARTTVGDRLRATQRRADALGATWLPPYVPRPVRDRVDVGGRVAWRTVGRRYVPATAVRALRWHFEDSASDASECRSVACLRLMAAWKATEPTVRWADAGEIAAWPVAWRVDAQRLIDRFAALATGTWCVWCDDTPAANGRGACRWCERTISPAVP
jgi:hypothetical protein